LNQPLQLEWNEEFKRMGIKSMKEVKHSVPLGEVEVQVGLFFVSHFFFFF
jgi:hypothetical protein